MFRNRFPFAQARYFFAACSVHRAMHDGTLTAPRHYNEPTQEREDDHEEKQRARNVAARRIEKHFYGLAEEESFQHKAAQGRRQRTEKEGEKKNGVQALMPRGA
jgi:hypothetical protein